MTALTSNFNDVDFNFIKELEGFETEGYVPDPENSKSGVTVASGFDLGARDVKDLKRLSLPKKLIKKLSPYLGLKGKEAVEKLQNFPLEITEEEGLLLNKGAKKETLEELSRKFKEDFERSFTSLSPEEQTVLASVGFQYGTGREQGLPSQKFWKQMGEGRLQDAYANLLNFRDRYDTRRRKEAKLLKSVFKLKTEERKA